MASTTRSAHLVLPFSPKWRRRFVSRDLAIGIAGVVIFAFLFAWWYSTLQLVTPPVREAARTPAQPASSAQVILPVAQLTRILGREHPLPYRLFSTTRLEQMNSSAVPALLAALSDRDPIVRIAAVQVLAQIRSNDSTQALLKATYDPVSDVREAAIHTLGRLGSLQAVPRLQQLQVVQTNFYVQQAAFLAEQELEALVARDLGLGPSQVQTLAVAKSGWVYAVTSDGVFANQDGTWRLLVSLPDQPTGVLAIDSDGQNVFVGTAAGLFKSVDTGISWESTPLDAAFGSQVRATAVAVDPLDSQKVYLALATVSHTSPIAGMPMGIYQSGDGGSSWQLLPDSPRDNTTRLILDTCTPGFLFGATGLGTWRYATDEYPVDSPES